MEFRAFLWEHRINLHYIHQRPSAQSSIFLVIIPLRQSTTPRGTRVASHIFMHRKISHRRITLISSYSNEERSLRRKPMIISLSYLDEVQIDVLPPKNQTEIRRQELFVSCKFSLQKPFGLHYVGSCQSHDKRSMESVPSSCCLPSFRFNRGDREIDTYHFRKDMFRDSQIWKLRADRSNYFHIVWPPGLNVTECIFGLSSTCIPPLCRFSFLYSLIYDK